MFRDVSACSGMFHLPGLIDALLLIKKRMTWFTPRLSSVKIEIKLNSVTEGEKSYFQN